MLVGDLLCLVAEHGVYLRRGEGDASFAVESARRVAN
jgi:hypothetical protein